MLKGRSMDFLGGAETVGEVDREMIRREIRKYRPAFEACYERELLANDSLSGTVDSTFSIMPNGQVRAARASGVSKGTSGCVAGVLSKIGTEGGKLRKSADVLRLMPRRCITPSRCRV